MAVEMRDIMAELCLKWRHYGPELGFGIGIARGYATLGPIGFVGRFDYSAIGTVVNLAARLCAEARSGQILVDTKVHSAIEEQAEIERISRLKRFLAPQVVDLILSSGDDRMLESHRGDISVVFCDLRGFTRFAEATEPEEVMAVLREYHASLGELIHRYEGTLDRFSGDGFMVLFNDPCPAPIRR